MRRNFNQPLSIGELSQAELLNKFRWSYCVGHVQLVSEHNDRHAAHLGVVDYVIELLTRLQHALLVAAVDHPDEA